MRRDKRMEIPVLGFDETNNGFSIPHAPFMIMTGVLGPEGRGYGTIPYGSKDNRRFFSERNATKEEILTSARTYLAKRPDFKYSIIPHYRTQTPLLRNSLKSFAISSLALSFMKDYSLPEEIPIYIHRIDGLKESKFVEDMVTRILNYAGINSPNVQVLKNPRSDREKEVVKDADMTGYYIAAIKFLLTPARWPFRNKKIPLKNLDDLIIERNLHELEE